MIGGNLLGVTCDGSVLEAYFWWLCTCVIFHLSFVYLGLTWVFLTWRVDSVLLKSFSTYGSLSCQSSLQQVSLWTCLTCEFLLQDFTTKLKIFSFSRIQDKILINNSFLSGMRNAFYMHFLKYFLCILYAFLMHFKCISYAFLMHFSKMHVFSSKMHVFSSKMHVFLKSAYKMHIKCL